MIRYGIPRNWFAHILSNPVMMWVISFPWYTLILPIRYILATKTPASSGTISAIHNHKAKQAKYQWYPWILAVQHIRNQSSLNRLLMKIWWKRWIDSLVKRMSSNVSFEKRTYAPMRIMVMSIVFCMLWIFPMWMAKLYLAVGQKICVDETNMALMMCNIGSGDGDVKVSIGS